MSKSFQQLVNKHKNFEFLENGKVKCTLTEHEIMPTEKEFKKYLESKSYKLALDGDFDIQVYYPFIVQHKKQSQYLHCNLTNTKLIKRLSVVQKHVQGKKYKKLQAIYEAEQKKIEEKQKAKEERRQIWLEKQIQEKKEIKEDEFEDEEDFDADAMDQFIEQAEDEEEEALRQKGAIQKEDDEEDFEDDIEDKKTVNKNKGINKPLQSKKFKAKKNNNNNSNNTKNTKPAGQKKIINKKIQKKAGGGARQQKRSKKN